MNTGDRKAEQVCPNFLGLRRPDVSNREGPSQFLCYICTVLCLHLPLACGDRVPAVIGRSRQHLQDLKKTCWPQASISQCSERASWRKTGLEIYFITRKCDKGGLLGLVPLPWARSAPLHEWPWFVPFPASLAHTFQSLGMLFSFPRKSFPPPTC